MSEVELMKERLRCKQVIGVVLIAILLILTIPLISGKAIVEASELRNPKTDDNGIVTWDCVWFGNYPQSEIAKPTAEITEAVYDVNGETVIHGVRYKRIKSSDAIYATSGIFYWNGEVYYDGCYDWSTGGDSNGYHYFKYEPIKWRILSVNGNDAFLLADLGLNDIKYNDTCSACSWETSSLRSYLNNTFLNSAFTASEKNAIYNTNVINEDNFFYGTIGGNDTIDKVYLLSYAEITDAKYGFPADKAEKDRARRLLSSDYAHAMGAENSTNSNCFGMAHWLLRSPGFDRFNAMGVDNDGSIYYGGAIVDHEFAAVRPALHLNISSTNVYSYAGTISSDGSINEQKKVINNEIQTENKSVTKYTTPIISKPNIKLKNVKGKKVKLTLSKPKYSYSGKISTKTKYEIMYAQNKNFTKGKKVKRYHGTLKTSSKTITKFKKKKIYYFKYRVSIKYWDTKYNSWKYKYSSWSNIKKIKIKK